MTHSIRPARPDDAPIIVEFNARLAQESEGKTLDRIVLKAGVDAILGDPNKGMYFLAEDAHGIAGQMMITLEWSDWRNGWIWWIQSVYVKPEVRRRGVFRALFEHVQLIAQQNPEVIGLRLYVERDNEAAHHTYQQMGMRWTSYLVMEKHPL